MFVVSQKILGGSMTGEAVGRRGLRGHRRSGRSRTPTRSRTTRPGATDLEEAREAECRAADGVAPMVKVRPWVPYLYCAPLVALLAFIFGYPMVKVVDFSTRLVRGSSGPFIGLDNYRIALDDPTFRKAARHSATLLLAVPVLLVISILVSVLLYEQVRGWRFYRSVLFMPYILAVPIVGIVASYMFQLHGVVNDLLAKVGPEVARDRLDRQRALRAHDRPDRDRLARGRLRHRALPGAHDEPGRRAAGGRAHRRRELVAAALARDPARDARHDRVLRRDRGDHDAGLGLRVRLDAHPGRARATRRRRSSSTSTTPARCSRCPAWPPPSRRCCSA